MKKEISELIKRLNGMYPKAHIMLKHSNNIELLVSVILSAQCTDVKVNEVTEKLFNKYRTLSDYASAKQEEFEQDIRQTGFFRNKAKNIIASANIIRDKFGGEIPRTMEDVLTLPGVARKTANIVLYNAYGIREGIAVDTHVKRLSGRLGLSKNTDPVKIEQDLIKIVPKEKWGDFSYLLIEHGRAVCDARKSKCDECKLNDICPSAFKF